MLGVTMAWNEADCIANAVNCLLDSEHEVHVFDHGSTDGTLDVLESFGTSIKVHRVDRKLVGFLDLFGFISRWINAQKGHGWVTWLAADELLMPPSREPLRFHHIWEARQAGIEVIDPFARRFWMSNADDPAEPDYLKRVRHFIPAPNRYTPRSWLHRLTGIMPHGLHRRPWIPPVRRPRGDRWPGGIGASVYWPKGTVISKEEWNADNYPIRSLGQARRKVKAFPQGPNRKRRRYAEYLEGGKALVYDSSKMMTL